MKWDSKSTNPSSKIELLIFALLLCQVLVNANDDVIDIYDDIDNDYCGDCITKNRSGTIPPNPSPQVRKQCQFPYTINGEVFDKCVKRRRPDWWCPTELDSSNNVLSEEWGFCNDCCPKEYVIEILYLKERNKDTDAQKMFCEIQNLNDKKKILLDIKINSTIAKELFESENCFDNTALIDGNDENDAVANKLKENCDEFCRADKENALEILEIAQNKLVNYFEKKEEEAKDYLKKISKTFKAVSELAVKYNEDVVRPDVVKQGLIEKIEKASDLGYLTPAQRNQMNKAVSDATSFDPLWTTQYNEIVDSTKRELRIKKENYLEEKKNKQRTKKESF
jgi:hypothetical protein